MPAEGYLRSRGITRFGPALRYHPAVRYRDAGTGELAAAPALLAKITDQSGEITGVSRTWLAPERRTIADMTDPKRVMGELVRSGVRFSDPASPILAVGEGVETVLSIGSVLPKLGLTACLSATHLGLFHVPKAVRELWILKDADEAGARAVRTLRERLEGRGIVIHEVEPVLGDFNDDLTAWGPDALRARLRYDFGNRIDELAG
ncbi:toprim domain-containing protein [Fulvimarina sp. 2208YS6-2-32]|uniref:Toprim domain-containing protein n=2 Tax=Fulvimarina uroteuthidis TaxID=3098149 RepID=A0ABU5I699_9HYPH|nr:toprim domain-containing protein [Fulvimarina sp. 2208YS6-2-32]MDY8110909.1 toprim domain-containing protein [Fulvimarina sp. 2208YS6-2-32]